MKIILTLMLCSLAAAAPNANPIPEPVQLGVLAKDQGPQRDLLDQLLPLIFELFREIMQTGYPDMGIPVLDPLQIDAFGLNVPAGLINLNLDLKGVYATGLSGFVLNGVRMDMGELSFYIDICLPSIFVSADYYDLIGDLFTAIPLYGKGTAVFNVENFCFQGKIYFGQSEDEKSIIIDRLDQIAFQIPFFKSELTGVIGGGDIDNVVNAIVNEVIIDYITRFNGFISAVITTLVPLIANPFLEQLESWEFIDNFERP